MQAALLKRGTATRLERRSHTALLVFQQAASAEQEWQQTTEAVWHLYCIKEYNNDRCEVVYAAA